MPAAETAPPLSEHQQLEAYKELANTLNAKIDTLNAPLMKKYREYQTARYDEQIALMQHRVAVFQWQEFASNVMLWVVVSVVISGLVFSAFQLVSAVRYGRDLQGNLELNAHGVRITSSVVGLLVLALSLGFIVLFLNQVYAVEVVHLS